MSKSILQWYAVRTATRREQFAADGLKERGFAAFLPCRTVWRHRPMTKEKVDRPLFVGYVFVLCSDEDFHFVQSIDGVHQFVRYFRDGDLTPVVIPFEAVTALQVAEARGEYDETRSIKPPYRPKKGERVKVTAGPWVTFIGKVLSTPTKDRAHVMIEGPHGRGVQLAVKHLVAA